MVTAVLVDMVDNFGVPVMLVVKVVAEVVVAAVAEVAVRVEVVGVSVVVISVLVSLLLHTWTPSNHVCWNLESPGSPQFLNHAPPVAQQLRLPDFLMVPHL